MKIGLTVTLATIIIFSNINPATPVVQKNTPEPMETIPTNGYAPRVVQINSTTIHIEGAICSCGANHDGYSRHGTVEFENYCPFCKKHGTLIIHNGWYKNTEIEELETSCQFCGADFCLVDGWDKSGYFRTRLKMIT